MKTNHKTIAKRLLKGRLAITGLAQTRLRQLILEMLRRVLDNINHPDMKRWLRSLHKRLRDAILAIVVEAVRMSKDLITNHYPLPADYVADEPEIKRYIYKYTRRLHAEILTWYAVRKKLGLSAQETIKAATAYLAQPYTNPYFIKAATLKKRSYGAGQYSSTFNSLRRLVVFTIARHFTKIQVDAIAKTHPLAYFIVRASSYPCKICEAQKGYHPIDDNNLPPYHPYCECIAYPVYATD